MPTTAHRPIRITAAERAALESATLHAHIAGRTDAAALTSLLNKLAPGNTTMAMLRRNARRTTAELLAPHLAQIDRAIARRRTSPEIEVTP
jgi:hypothetical protein